MQDEKGDWKLVGPHVLLVPKASAIHSRSWEHNEAHYSGVPCTHSNLVKFNFELFEMIWPRMQALAERAVAKQGRLKSSTKCILCILASWTTLTER